MRAVVQRVLGASVEVDGDVVGETGPGILVYIGVMKGDDQAEARALAEKIGKLRIFPDDDGKTNLSIKDVGGTGLVVSQFTLGADISKGNRPSFAGTAAPDLAEELYDYFCACLRVEKVPLEKGVFGANMRVHSVNDGPFTIYIDTQ